jgi:hypothetical protein
LEIEVKPQELVTASLLLGLAVAARSQSLPTSVAACAGETDVLKRLSCYDRAVAPFLSGSHPTPGPAGASPPMTAPHPGEAAAAASVAPVAATAHPPAEAPVDSTRHVQARIERIDTYPDGIVVHLDNGQVWQEDEDTPVDLGLRPGDSVSLDRQMGSFWITGRHGATAKVRLKN